MAGLERLIDGLIADLMVRRHVGARTESLKLLGPAAVPLLLRHLERGERARTTIAFYALQYCWSAAAVPAVRPFLADPDPDLRLMARIVLVKGEGFATTVRLLEPLIDHPDAGVAADAFDLVEEEAPDPLRLAAAAARPTLRPALARHLPRYQGAAFADLARDLAADPDPRLAAGGLAALAAQGAGDAAAAGVLAITLASPHAGVRELAGEALARWGSAAGPDLRGALARALETEPDPWARAALVAAQLRPPPSPQRPPERAALAGHVAFRGEALPHERQAAEQRAEEALAAWLASPPPGEDRGPFRAPPVSGVIAPVRDFIDPGRETYGRLISDSAVPGFRGLHHLGEDCGWDRPGGAVVAVADGQMRFLGLVPTWGWLVVIEHRDAGGAAWCSLYGHLGPLILAAPGEVVQTGRKIGAIGRAYCYENGGYRAHLHFGIHRGPWLQPPHPGSVIDLNFEGRARRGLVEEADDDRTLAVIRQGWGWRTVVLATSWLRGYCSPAWWEAGDHGWEAPQAFLAARGLEAG